ncbi:MULTISPECIES: endo alpha-1,4 polygalactosaminidase [unclassified Streptomyces]|uniref:endo alpha-1,4 polygalactosaminidase n=1 Tax=unclassified Streptomyces TaxID=2593676 RepID=UPI003D702AB8
MPDRRVRRPSSRRRPPSARLLVPVASVAAVLAVLAGCTGGGGGDGRGRDDRGGSGGSDRGAAHGGGSGDGGREGSPGASSPPPRPSSPAGSPSPPGARRVWVPRPGLAWQWQLNGKADPGVDVPVYDIDGFENSAADVARLHRDGRKVICYVNVGAWEDFRPDADAFPRSLLGRANGWEGERWLDIRRSDALRPLMARRFDMCRDKGFDAVEPDLVEGYAADTGFPLTARDQLAYNRMIAGLAHERGLSVGLKNDLAQIPQLVDDFDFAVNEECAEFDECALLSPFIEAGKAVFHVEYEKPNSSFCAESRRLKLSSMRKNLGLDAWREPC